MIKIGIQKDSLTIAVKAKPKSGQNGIQHVRAGALLVTITAAPEKGKANRAIIDLFSKSLKIPKRQIEIISGETHTEKVLKISGLSCPELASRLGLAGEDLCSESDHGKPQ